MRSGDPRRSIALLALVFLTACGGEDRVAGSAEVNLDIVHPDSGESWDGFAIDRVDYRVTCPGNPPGTYPIPPADTAGTDYVYDDSVDMSGAFEVVDTRSPPIWQAAMDLPPGNCTITLLVWDGDEVACVGSETLLIVEGMTTKYNIVLVCSLSVDTPEGELGVDGTLDFIDGNYCPQLIWVGADPSVLAPVVPAVTNIETYAFDPDNACGENCDPQTCDFSVNPPVCSAAPDPGLSTTWAATSGAGSFADIHAVDTTYTCDPLFPGPTELCVLASDGDIECDHRRCLTVVCP